MKNTINLNNNLFEAIRYKPERTQHHEGITTHNYSFTDIHELLTQGADPNFIMTEMFETPFSMLIYAVEISIPEHIAVMLIDFGANVSQKDQFDHSPLFIACRLSKPAIVTALLKSGADVHRRDKNGMTALHSALSAGADPSIVEMLLKEGINPLTRDKNGKTPEDYAKESYNRSKRMAYITLLHSYKPSLLHVSLFALKNHQKSGKLGPIAREDLPQNLIEKASKFGIQFS